MEYAQTDIARIGDSTSNGAAGNAGEAANADVSAPVPVSPKKAATKTAKKTAKKARKKKAKKKPSSKASKAGKPDGATPADGESKAKSKRTSKKSASKSAKGAKKSEAAIAVPASAKGKKLVIVESPAKAKTINKYLGSGYIVKASVGHIRDLPKSKLGIDVENSFTPQYMTIRGKKDVIDELRKYSKVSKEVFLATDPDREGEAIAWHLKEALELQPATTHRVTFNEITKDAVKRAFDHPRDIAGPVVDAYQARRVLDRLVGYQISPILWRKIAWGLSAGRVQSVAQRLICEREREIGAFNPVEYWTMSAYLLDAAIAKALSPQQSQSYTAAIDAYAGKAVELAEENGAAGADTEAEEEAPVAENGDAVPAAKPQLPPNVFRADLRSWKGEPPSLSGKADSDAVLGALKNAPWRVAKVETKSRADNPKKPFITSTLQQAAANRLGFTARRTMRAAQMLYEGVELGEEGATGLITYMRTDSVHLSDFAMDEAREVIKGMYGDKYVPESKVIYKTSSKAQAAHEAIRPTSAVRTPSSVRKYLDEDQFRLYTLIWERFIACQMVPAEFEVTTVDVEAGEAVFRASGRRLVFDGHLRVAGYAPSPGAQDMPKLSDGQALDCRLLHPDQHFTQPPPRFTEASLVKTLEKLGIGRPSTYASIISTIVDRGYVKKEGRAFHATELGLIVNDLLVGNFARVVDTDFTAKMETQLDQIEEGNLNWVEVMSNFNELFKTELEVAEERIAKIKGIAAKDAHGNEVPCPLCSTPMVTRWSKDGKFFGCANYPECKGTLPVGADGNPIQLTKEDIQCPKCTAPMVVRMSSRGAFLGCSEFPKCRGTRALESSKSAEEKTAERQFAGLVCNKCGSDMAVRVARGRPFVGCTAYPECKNAMSIIKVEAAVASGEMEIDPERRERQIARMDEEAAKQAAALPATLAS